MSEYFRVRLLQLEFDRPAAVRIQGLAIGIDVGDEDSGALDLMRGGVISVGRSIRPGEVREEGQFRTA